MKKRLFHVSIAAVALCVLLAPALIWSGHGPQATKEASNEDQGVFKEPPFFTVGPPMTREELAARELEKLRSIRESQAWFQDDATAVDLPWPPRADTDPGIWGPKPQTHLPESGAPLRSLGPEGLTAQEKAKLDASRSPQEKTNGNEWGRSR